MLNEPSWITPDTVIELNRRILLASGEPHGLVSYELLESGLQRAKNLCFYENITDVADLATSVLFGIAQNHPFIQGNKRTSYYTMVGFLGINSFRLKLADDTRVGRDIRLILDGKLDQDTFAPNLRRVIEFVEMVRWGT